MLINLLLFFPFVALAALMLIDDLIFHHQRGLEAWERIGHPVDSLSLVLCLLWLRLAPLTESGVAIYAGLALCSALLVTKDEFVHARSCRPGEQWLHALLFILHPLVLLSAAFIHWLPRFAGFSYVVDYLIVGAAGFMLYQLIYWNFIYGRIPFDPR